MEEHQPCPLLGRLLLASSAIQPQELQRALRREGETRKALRDILVETGALEPGQLDRALETQARLWGNPKSASAFVLLVDDDLEVGALVRDVLVGAGYRVGVAQNEAEAMAAVLASDGRCPDLLVLDLGLPGGGGIELLSDLRKSETTRDMRVVVLTGHAEMESDIRARGLEISEFLVKPVPVRELVAVVDAVLAGARPVAGPTRR